MDDLIQEAKVISCLMESLLAVKKLESNKFTEERTIELVIELKIAAMLLEKDCKEFLK